MSLPELRKSSRVVRREGSEQASGPAQASHRPLRPPRWRSPLRGPWLTSLLGTLLVPAIVVMALTGFISHWAHHPGLLGNDSVNPSSDIPSFFQFTASWPSWGYAATQGIHVTLGLMTVPLLLAKLWSVMPKLFQRPAWHSLAAALERLSLLLLVGSVLVEFATGILDVDNSEPFNSAFYPVHYYGAWVFGTAFVLHALVKLPTVRRAYRERGLLRPLREGLGDTRPEPPVDGGLAPVDPTAPTLSRRGLLAMVGGAALTIFVVQAGESIGGGFRRFALLAPRGRVFGTGPNDFQVNNTAAERQITPAMTGAAWRLTVAGGRTVSLDRQALLGMTQSTHTLTIACTEGWSTTQHWTGVTLASLARLAGAAPGSVLRARSLVEAGGSVHEASFSEAQVRDGRSLLALRVNGVDLSLDHGYPARLILPNVPGTQNLKWVSELRFVPA
jgi:DMSO/TMAO reductase YedYZ molybdopterin-dependent catalytic subunit